MPKAERGTPKDIANRMKAKGLQKLKFYCQMCAKQCRDENGFKCHMTSDSHLRQMRIFRENAGGMMDSFSREFETAYLETLRRRHGTQRMNANNVYQEVIQDKHHVHMNSTKWTTLTDFVQYLGKKGLCVVDETERGWYVTYIERDPTLLSRQEKMQKKMEADQREERLAAEKREALRMEAARALDRAGRSMELKASEIGDRGEGGGIRMKMKLGSQGAKKRKMTGKISGFEEEEEEEKKEGVGMDGTASNTIPSNRMVKHSIQRYAGESKKAPKPKLERRNDAETNAIKRQKVGNNDIGRHHADGRKDYWLYRDIVVRIISKDLADGEYYRRKAVVDKVVDRYQAEVEVLESSPGRGDGGDVLRLDQDDLETVMPKELGRKVRIVNGRHRGKKARVERLDKATYRAELRLVEDGSVVRLDYEDFSRMG